MSKENIEIDYKGSNKPEDILKWALDTFGQDVALACSFSPEDIAIIHIMMNIRSDARVFAIDTGRLNEETYECADAVRKRLGVNLEWYFPERKAVEDLECEKGLFSFRESLDNRHECCQIRKVEPLNRALSGLKAWITGLRREQSVTRTDVGSVERDEAHGGIAKINPLIDWSEDETWRYIRQHELPYNLLHDAGYPSIGCAPCTRPIEAGEHPRAGRWWWETPEQKECGLHTGKPRRYNI